MKTTMMKTNKKIIRKTVSLKTLKRLRACSREQRMFASMFNVRVRADMSKGIEITHDNVLKCLHAGMSYRWFMMHTLSPSDLSKFERRKMPITNGFWNHTLSFAQYENKLANLIVEFLTTRWEEQ